MYTERKTDPKSRYFPMFESTFEKCSIQLSVEPIQPDIPRNSMNHTSYRVESALPRVESNLFRKLIQTSENIWIWGLFFFQCIYTIYRNISIRTEDKNSFQKSHSSNL